MTDSETPDDETNRLRAELAEAHRQNRDLAQRLHEVIAERGRLLDEVRIYRAQRKAAGLNDELKRLGILESDDDGRLRPQ